MPLKKWVGELRAPKQYLSGFSEFYKLKFKVTPDVLIPRPETEILVDEVLKFAEEKLTDQEKITIFDIGTGSGIIAISIAKNLKKAKIFAIDISKKALEITKLNVKFHKAEKQIFLLENDLITNLKTAPDIIACNLPYIPTARLMFIDPLVRDFEPRLALDGGTDGLEIYRRLFSQMLENKIFPKMLIAEIDEDQGYTISLEARRFFPEAEVEIKKDLAKKDRFLVIYF